MGTTMEDIRAEQIQDEIDAAKDRKRRLYQKIATGLTAGAMAATVPVLLSPIFKDDQQTSAELVARQANEVAKQAVAVRIELDRTRGELKIANARLAAAEKGISHATDPATELRLANLEKKLGTIEQTILDDPTKALQLPLLRRDLEAVKENTAQANASTKQSVDQIYDLNKWLLGSMAVGVLLLGLSHFFRKKVD